MESYRCSQYALICCVNVSRKRDGSCEIPKLLIRRSGLQDRVNAPCSTLIFTRRIIVLRAENDRCWIICLP